MMIRQSPYQSSFHTRILRDLGLLLALGSSYGLLLVIGNSNWFFPTNKQQHMEAFAIICFILGVGLLVSALFSWVADNNTRRQRPWWTQ